MHQQAAGGELQLKAFPGEFAKTVGRELDYKALGCKKLSGPA